MHKKLVLFSLLSIFSFDAYSASLRDKRDIFAEPAKGGLAQMLLGGMESAAAYAAWPGLEREERALAEAEKQLALLRNAPLSETERAARRDALAATASQAERRVVNPGAVLPLPANVPGMADEIDFLRSNEAMTSDVRAARIAAQEEVVAKRAEEALRAAQADGLLEKILGKVSKIARLGPSVILITDVGSRLYVWSALEANPGFSPVAGYTYEQLRALLGY